MIVLVMGGNRFVGKKLVMELAKWDEVDLVYVFNRSGTGLRHKKVRILKGDRNNPKDLAIVPWDDIEFVVDMCLYKVKQLDLLLKYVKKKNYTFVSSIAATLDPEESGFGEYGEQKRLVEEKIRKEIWKNCIIRPTYVLSSPGLPSPHDRDRYFLDCLYSGVPIQIDGDGTAELTFIFANDVVRTLGMTVFHRWNDSLDPNQREVNLAGFPITVIDLIKMFEKYSKKKAELFFDSPDSPFDNKRVVFSDKKGTFITGYDDGVKLLIEEYEKTIQN